MEEDIEDIVDELTNEKFNEFCSIDGCNEAILDAVRERVKQNVEKLIHTDKKTRNEVFQSQSLQLTAIFYNEKLMYERSLENESKDMSKVMISN